MTITPNTAEGTAQTSSRTLVLDAPSTSPSTGEVDYPLAAGIEVPGDSFHAVLDEPQSRARHAALIEAFASFMELDVANGQATPDTIKGYFEVVRGLELPR